DHTGMRHDHDYKRNGTLDKLFAGHFGRITGMPWLTKPSLAPSSCTPCCKALRPIALRRPLPPSVYGRIYVACAQNVTCRRVFLNRNYQRNLLGILWSWLRGLKWVAHDLNAR